MRRRTMRLACLLLVLVAPAALALDPTREISQYARTVWTLQEGYLPGAPMEMAQTVDGYLWIGTRSGLVRFDGVRFAPFTPASGQQLRSNRILSLRAGNDGSLWIGTRSGLHRYRDGQLTHYPDAPGWIVSILEDRDGKIWFTRSSISDDKGALCEVQGDRAVCHGAADGVAVANGRQLSTDAQGNLWTVSDNTLMRWKAGAGRTWLPPGISATGADETLDVLQSVAVAADGSVWVGAMQPTRDLGLLRLVDGKLQPYVVPGLDGRKVSVAPVFFDRQNTMWVGTQDEGLYRVHDGKVSQFRARDGLSSDTVQGVFEDREGTLWVMTTRGIEAFRDLRVVSVTSREGLSADLANAVLATRDGTVWINAWHSLDALRDGKITSLNSKNGLPGEEVTALFEDRAGTFWVGIDHDFTVFDGGKFNPVRRPNGRPLGVTRGVVEDSAGDLWALTALPNSLIRIRNRKVIEEIPREKIPFDRAIVADPNEGIWLSARNGDLGRYRRGQLETIPFHREPGTGVITALVADPEGSIVGSTNLGLVGWRNGKPQTMTAATNALPCDEVHTLLMDRHGGLWLYAACGIIAIAPDQVQAWWKNASARLSFRVFDALDGAQPAYGNFFPRASVGPDGRLWFANASVVQVIDPDRLGSNTLPPPVHIEQVIADRAAFTPQDGLQLPPNTRDLEIDYTGLSLVIPRKTQFRYRLDGHDTEWHDAGTRRQAFYTDLPPGDYRFQVTASNNDGVWNESGTSLNFSIPPTFYQTRYFMVLCIAVVLGAVWLLFLLRLRQIASRMRARLEERLVERERIARELHDTLLQGVQGLILKFQTVADRVGTDEETRAAMEQELERADALLIEGRDRVKNMRSTMTTTVSLRQALLDAAQQMSAGHTARLRVIENGTPRELHPIVREEAGRIASEAMLNALRHANATTIDVELFYERKHLRICIRDDGRGMESSMAAEGRDGHFGLLGMRERAKRIRGRLTVWSRVGAGTEVSLIVPARMAYDRGNSNTRRLPNNRESSE